MSMTPNVVLEGRILFQNEACMVINKRAGESSESDWGAAEGGGRKFPAPVHRLDTPVSGCLLLAKTPEAAAFLGAAFARHDSQVIKHYWAIIEKPPASAGFRAEAELVHWLSENRKLNKAFAAPWSEGPPPQKGRGTPPKKAVLRYRTLGQGDHYLFLEIDLVTGRHHQIRAQLAARGLHIKGDLKYGARRSDRTGCIRLHAYSLAFPDPLNPGGIIEVKALPPEMDPLWTAFGEAVL